MISFSEITMGREKKFPAEFTDEVKSNIEDLLVKANKVRALYGRPMIISSGWRPESINQATAGSAKSSRHITGQAFDVSDKNGEFWQWCIKNLHAIAQIGLFIEDRRWTPSWVHLQSVQPRSGRRIFVPSLNQPLIASAWDGNYDASLDVPPIRVVT